MRARRDARDARKARDVRQVQEQAALERLRAQNFALAKANRDLETLAANHASAQRGWSDALTGTVLDPSTATLWRLHSAAALHSMREQETVVQSEAYLRSDRQDEWTRHLRLVEAARTVERRTAVVLQKKIDENALSTAEGLFHARKGVE